MAEKYKLLITLWDDNVIDSEEMDGIITCPNYSQAEHITLKGVFDSYEEAQKEASGFELYQCVLYTNRDKNSAWLSYDSVDREGMYFFSPYDAEDYALHSMNPLGFRYAYVNMNVDLYADEYVINELDEDDWGYCPGEKYYKFTFFLRGKKVLCSTDDSEVFDSFEEADEEAQSYENRNATNADEKYIINRPAMIELDCDVQNIEIKHIEIAQVD